MDAAVEAISAAIPTPRQTSTSPGAAIVPPVSSVGTKIVWLVVSEHPFLVTVTPTTIVCVIVPTGAV